MRARARHDLRKNASGLASKKEGPGSLQEKDLREDGTREAGKELVGPDQAESDRGKREGGGDRVERRPCDALLCVKSVTDFHLKYECI